MLQYRGYSASEQGEALFLCNAPAQGQDDFVRGDLVGAILHTAAAGQALGNVADDALVKINFVVQQSLGKGDLAARYHCFGLYLFENRAVCPACTTFNAFPELLPVVFYFLMFTHLLSTNAARPPDVDVKSSAGGIPAGFIPAAKDLPGRSCPG